MLMGCADSAMLHACFFADSDCSTSSPASSLGYSPPSRYSASAESTSPNPLMVDRSHYNFQHAIGSGGFGIVQYATKLSEPDKHKSFAIKSLSKASILKRKSGLVSIFTELKILSAISHVFICNSHFAFQDATYLYLVLDLARGGDLRFNLSISGGRFGESRTRFYAAQVVQALEYLHSLGVIHRDIKPENILLNDDGYIKLTDFGVSKVLSSRGDCRSTSGTHGYMAPELYVPPGFRHGTAADWFALGVTVYELLLGQRPFDSRTLKGNQCGDGGLFPLRLTFQQHGCLSHQHSKYGGLSTDCRDFLQGLMHARPEVRLTGLQDQRREGCIPRRSSMLLLASPFVRMHPWLRSMDWEMLLHRALPVPCLPDTHIVRSCLSPADACAVLQRHQQAEAVADDLHAHFAEYSLVRDGVRPFPTSAEAGRDATVWYPSQQQHHAMEDRVVGKGERLPADGCGPTVARQSISRKVYCEAAAISSTHHLNDHHDFGDHISKLHIDTASCTMLSKGKDSLRQMGIHEQRKDVPCPSSSSVLSDESDNKRFKDYAARYVEKRNQSVRQTHQEEMKCHKYQSLSESIAMEDFGTDMDSETSVVPKSIACFDTGMLSRTPSFSFPNTCMADSRSMFSGVVAPRKKCRSSDSGEYCSGSGVFGNVQVENEEVEGWNSVASASPKLSSCFSPQPNGSNGHTTASPSSPNLTVTNFIQKNQGQREQCRCDEEEQQRELFFLK